MADTYTSQFNLHPDSGLNPSTCIYFLGVKLFEEVSVEGVEVTDGKVSGVKTNKGSIECEIFVNCAGQVSFARWLHIGLEWHWT